jgi:hypothetical protein
MIATAESADIQWQKARAQPVPPSLPNLRVLDQNWGVIRGQNKFQKEIDTPPQFQIACKLPSRVHRRGKQLRFIYEKKINIKICLL